MLRQHSEIFLAPDKEIHFFDEDFYYKKGPDWYLAHFRNADKKIIGEITPAYILKKVPKRIKKVLGNLKILLIARNPVDRLYSHYRFLIKESGYRHNFNYFLEHIQPNSLYRGEYFEILTSYLDVFPKENIKIIFFEDIEANPKKVLQETFKFLGVNDSYTPKRSLFKKIHKSLSIRPRFLLALPLEILFTLGQNLFRNSKKRKDAKMFIRKLAFHILKICPFLFAPIPELNKELREKVYVHYKDDIKKFSKLVNRDLSHWR